MDARAVIAPDRGRGVARAVVHEQHVHRQPAGLGRNAGEHAADGHLLVAGDHDGEAALPGVGCRRLHRLVLHRYERPAARRLGLRHAEQAGDGRGPARAPNAARARWLPARRPRPRPQKAPVARPSRGVRGRRSRGPGRGRLSGSPWRPRACRAPPGRRGSRRRGDQSLRAGRGIRGCARRARGRAGRRRAVGARAGPGPPPRRRAGPPPRASGRSPRSAAPR